jgi:hypothetical protein
LTVDSVTGMTTGMSITVMGAGVSGVPLYSTISSISGNTITLSSRSYTTVSGATVYTNYGYGGLRFGNSTDASPGDVDCFWENNTIVDTRTVKKQMYGIRLDGPINGVTLRDNRINGYIEYDIQTTYMSAGSTLYVYGATATSIPTTGTWTAGTVIYNSAPTSGGYIGWVCVTAGTPGTWKTFGLIS